MKTKNKPQVYILCEDQSQYDFARKYFELRGIDNIRGRYSPQGRGSGEQFVRENYAKEVKTYRSKANHLNLALVVIIDADKQTERLNSVLVQNPRFDDEKILIFIPARNIETWFHYIEGYECNEQDCYKNQYKGAKPTQFAKKLATQICPHGLPDNALSSLHHACVELQRLSLA
jgi:hypothetical protein